MRRGLLRTYLLERSRVTGVRDPERNYHIFYCLLHAHEDDFLPDLPCVRWSRSADLWVIPYPCCALLVPSLPWLLTQIGPSKPRSAGSCGLASPR